MESAGPAAAAATFLELAKQLVEVGEAEKLLSGVRRCGRFLSAAAAARRRFCRHPAGTGRRGRGLVDRGGGEAPGRAAQYLSHVVHGDVRGLGHSLTD